jgi:hypothetical protein
LHLWLLLLLLLLLLLPLLGLSVGWMAARARWPQAAWRPVLPPQLVLQLTTRWQHVLATAGVMPARCCLRLVG